MLFRTDYLPEDVESEDDINVFEYIYGSYDETEVSETFTEDSSAMIIERLDAMNESLEFLLDSSLNVTDSLLVIIVFLGSLLGAQIIRSLRK